ncbi:MAG: hypothetical protein NVSMB64_29610 [Candidatus Velthaea sp.]
MRVFMCDGKATFQPKIGTLTVAKAKFTCDDAKAKVAAIVIGLTQVGINLDFASPKTLKYRKCAEPISSTCDLGPSIDFAISGGTGIYKAFFVPIVLDGIFVDFSSMGTFAEDAFPYNDSNKPYPHVYPFGMSTLMPFPAPPFVDCRGIAGTTAQCPDGNSRMLRANLVQQFTAANQPQFIPPGGYDAHHVKPTSCGGDNAAANGAFLARSAHQSIVNSWWSDVSPCGRNGNAALD